MKGINFNRLLATIRGLTLLVFGSCDVACDRNDNAHPLARAAMESLDETNLLNRWRTVSDFAMEVQKERHLSRLAIDGHNVFAIQGDQVIDAKLTAGKLLASADATQVLKQTDSEHILAWIRKCETNGVCGFDLRALPAYYRIFIRNDVCFVILVAPESHRYSTQFAAQAKRGHTPRGDIFAIVTNGVFIATERR